MKGKIFFIRFMYNNMFLSIIWLEVGVWFGFRISLEFLSIFVFDRGILLYIENVGELDLG